MIIHLDIYAMYKKIEFKRSMTSLRVVHLIFAFIVEASKERTCNNGSKKDNYCFVYYSAKEIY